MLLRDLDDVEKPFVAHVRDVDERAVVVDTIAECLPERREPERMVFAGRGRSERVVVHVHRSDDTNTAPDEAIDLRDVGRERARAFDGNESGDFVIGDIAIGRKDEALGVGANDGVDGVEDRVGVVDRGNAAMEVVGNVDREEDAADVTGLQRLGRDRAGLEHDVPPLRSHLPWRVAVHVERARNGAVGRWRSIFGAQDRRDGRRRRRGNRVRSRARGDRARDG